MCSLYISSDASSENLVSKFFYQLIIRHYAPSQTKLCGKILTLASCLEMVMFGVILEFEPVSSGAHS